MSELSGISGELIDVVAAAIRGDGSDMKDTPWEILSDERKAGWLGDAERAIAALIAARPSVKKCLTTGAALQPEEKPDSISEDPRTGWIIP